VASSIGEERRKRLETARLYVVTDAREEKRDLPAFLDAILGAGVDIVQLREKNAEAGDVIRWARIFRKAADKHGALFTVNDRADLAIACEADVLHVGQNDLPSQWARRIVGPDMILGLSCHSPGDHDNLPSEVDYVTAGPVWATPTKPGREATGLELVTRAAHKVKLPWFAIGGIDGGNVRQIVRAGGRRIVVVRAVTEAEDPVFAVKELLSALPKVNQ
jgi:thiamine-phosphate pyrophosphorylase